jgi:2-methylcitrate dehydratase PrpD
MPEPSLTQTLGRLVAETVDIPDAVVQRAKVSLVHNLAVALAGRERERVAHAMARRFWALPAEATMLFDGRKVNLDAAAFANGALMHARSQDDTHAGSTSHPGAPTMAAALAMGEAVGCSGAAFLGAVVLGYEVLCRVGRDFDHLMTANGFRAASVIGAFGAAAAAARLQKFSAQQTADALGLAANMGGGLAQVWREGSAESPLQLGFAARNGVIAVRAVMEGAGSARLALEGEAGFFRAYAGATAAAVEAIEGLGHDWQMLEVTVKQYPVCAILQGPVGRFLALFAAEKLRAEQVAEIRLGLSPYEADYPGIDNAGPFASAIATKMSAQFSLGLAATDGRVTPVGLGRVTDGRVLGVADRVRVERDGRIPVRHSRLEVRLMDGRTLTGVVDAPAGRPSFDEAARFARSLAPEMGARESAVDRLVDVVAGLERAASVEGLIAAALGCGG